ncbi:hypothetical protein L596_020037 [Steinernema carpocapsae]|uniref:Uncharacterized protein n=1 Tax=Steinernema carpocapsae TaxID=34508 RepID=A0A4U5MSJ9_STECR|nr:hypothetical protein L596_020037 [Steinernema carpocapsae]
MEVNPKETGNKKRRRNLEVTKPDRGSQAHQKTKAAKDATFDSYRSNQSANFGPIDGSEDKEVRTDKCLYGVDRLMMIYGVCLFHSGAAGGSIGEVVNETACSDVQRPRPLL